MTKNGNWELLADCTSILKRWKDYLSQLLNVHINNDVGDIKILNAEPLVPEPTSVEVEIAIENWKVQVSRYRVNFC